jgi:L-ascorbate metabolism protein UlaG (beta-lactamase superfamily)
MYNSPNFNGKVFVNPIPTALATPGGMWRILGEYLKSHPGKRPATQLGPFYTDKKNLNLLNNNSLSITWLGHSTLLIEIDGKRFLTDPVWAERVSPFSFIGPKRFFSPPLSIDDLPHLDGIIISHDHFDHLDKAAVQKLVVKNIPFYVSLGVEKILCSWGVDKRLISSFDWWQDLELSDGFKITAAPARHFSGRSLNNRNQTLWASYVIRGPQHCFYYGADSGMHPLFKEIGERLGPFDVTSLEIGAYHELWPDIHMGPENAAEAQVQLGSGLLLPIHWGTYDLAFHNWKEPIERLIKASILKNIKLIVPEPGEAYLFNNQSYINTWWKKSR